MALKMPSTTKANPAISIPPIQMSTSLFVVIPRYMATPRPPAPTKEAIPAKAMVMVTMFMMAANITGNANGNCIFHKICRSVLPMARLASIIFGSMVVIPT